PDWPVSFVVSGGGGGGRREMLRDNRGPFSRSTLGFAHLRFDDQTATIRLLNERGVEMHAFTRAREGTRRPLSNSPSDPATKHPLRVIVGLDKKNKKSDQSQRPSTQPEGRK